MTLKPKNAAIIWLIAAIVFFALNVIALYNVIGLYSHSEKTTGVVTDYIVKSKSKGGISNYLYTVMFKASNGTTYTTYTETGSHEIGDSVELQYDNRNPENSYASFWDIWIFVILLSPATIIASIVAIKKFKHKI
jgi:hypothetical protein